MRFLWGGNNMNPILTAEAGAAGGGMSMILMLVAMFAISIF